MLIEILKALSAITLKQKLLVYHFLGSNRHQQLVAADFAEFLTNLNPCLCL